MKKKCGYSKCGVEFEDTTRNQNKEFCCNSHRVLAGRQRAKHLGDVTTVSDKPTLKPSNQIQTPSGLDFNTQLSFDLLKKESDRWENAFNKEQDKREKLEDQLKGLQKEYSEFKQAKEIEAIKGEKPTALAGFMESSFMQGIMPHIAPHIGDIVGKIKDKALGAAALSGMSPEDEAIAKWLSTQTPEIQLALRTLITSVAGLNDEKTIQNTLVSLVNMVQKGTVNAARPIFKSTGTF